MYRNLTIHVQINNFTKEGNRGGLPYNEIFDVGANQYVRPCETIYLNIYKCYYRIIKNCSLTIWIIEFPTRLV